MRVLGLVLALATLALPTAAAGHTHDFGGGLCVMGYGVNANAQNDYHYPLFDFYLGVVIVWLGYETYGSDAQYRARCCAIANQAWYCYL